MSKKAKKKTESKNSASATVRQTDSVWERRNRELRSLQTYIASLKKSIAELESKIDSQGLSGFYSQNHDCMRYSEAVWRSCLRLAMLKELDEEINGEDVK
tara:strand:- start:385 stop:684 length:300 start_codon:yes stop_codon:yes gene_type:complete